MRACISASGITAITLCKFGPGEESTHGPFFVAIATYTGVTISHHGWNLVPVFFGDIAVMAWPGQFNFDFLCFLLLSALWISWRHNFSAAGLALGAAALVGGMLFLSAYLFVVAGRGDARKVLLGEAWAKA